MGEMIDKAKGAFNNVVGNTKQESDNPDTRAEGQQQELKGDMQDKKGDVEGALGDDI